jgi:hypothetical protein
VGTLRYVVRFLVALPLFLCTLTPQATPVAAGTGFTFNWDSDPASPQPWVPGTANDWDVIANIDAPTDATGAMAAGHGSDCVAPPATHPITSLADSVYLCKKHMMTAINGGGDAAATYGAVYLTPAQLLDWSQGPATLTWQVSTERLSARDWWAVNLTPFDQNMVLPLAPEFPAYHGEPATGLELRLDQATCASGHTGSFLRVSTVSRETVRDITASSPCVEEAVAPSFRVRTPFEVDLSASHLRVLMPGTGAIWYDGPISLPFNQAVVQFSHHSYNPGKADNPDGSHGLPNTYHWSGVSIAPNAPFSMLRPQQPVSLHEGRNPTLTLAEPAPANAFARFAALGAIQVSADGGRSFVAARSQDAVAGMPERFSSYWTSVPAGTTQLTLRGQPNQFGQPWWVQDVSVWAHGAPRPVPAAGPTARPPGGGGITQGHEVLQPRPGAATGSQAQPARPAAAGGLHLPRLSTIRSALGAPGSFWPGFLAGVLVAALAGAGILGWRRLDRRRVRTPPPR